MCSNRALVDSMECYMDDLVDCFEDFVKKSLILISVGVGTVLVMLVYMFKVLSGRDGTSALNRAPEQDTVRSAQAQRSNTSLQSDVSKGSLKRNATKNDFKMPYNEPILTCTSVNTLPIAATPSFDERVLRDTGFSMCKKNSATKKTSSPSRIVIPSRSCLPEQFSASRSHVKVLKRNSCCSMCCADDK